ncbi:MAG: hypothetical protein Q9168_008414, partial [Polycauliona sp. 1 TL-2023]
LNYMERHGHHRPDTPYYSIRPDKEVVVYANKIPRRDSGWVMPADSPSEVRRGMEKMVARDFEALVGYLRELGKMSWEERRRLEGREGCEAAKREAAVEEERVEQR